MRYHLPGDAHRSDPTVGRVAPVRRAPPAGARTASGSADAGGSGPAELIVRTVPMAAAGAPAYLARWEAGPPPGRPLAVEGRVEARERLGGGHPRRVQRLAVAVAGRDAIAVHWSSPQPVAERHEQTWRRIVAELAERADRD